MCVCVHGFKFAAQTRLSNLHDEIEKAEQQILRATEEFKQLEEAIHLKKVCKSKAAMLRGNAKNAFSLHNHVKQCCLISYRITDFRVKYGFSIFQLHFPFIHNDILLAFYKVCRNKLLVIYIRKMYLVYSYEKLLPDIFLLI